MDLLPSPGIHQHKPPVTQSIANLKSRAVKLTVEVDFQGYDHQHRRQRLIGFRRTPFCGNPREI